MRQGNEIDARFTSVWPQLATARIPAHTCNVLPGKTHGFNRLEEVGTTRVMADMWRSFENSLKSFWCWTVFGGLVVLLSAPALAQSVRTSEEQGTSSIAGTAIDPNGDPVPGASVTLRSSRVGDPYSTLANETGYFELHNLESGMPYRVTVHSDGFEDWVSPDMVLEPGQHKILTDCILRLAKVETSIDVGYSPVQVATEQVAIQEKQRILGVVPNFYVTYEAHPEPMTPKLKFELAMKLAGDPVTAVGVGFVAGVRQATNSIDFQQGAKGYGQRFGVTAANAFSGIMIGFHALSYAFVCPGDNGRLQPNYSSLGGNLAAAALSNAYYPSSNRGPGLVIGNFAIGTLQRALTGLAQEFLFRRYTSNAPK